MNDAVCNKKKSKKIKKCDILYYFDTFSILSSQMTNEVASSARLLVKKERNAATVVTIKHFR